MPTTTETNGQDTARPLFRKSLETQLLEDRLSKVAVGDVIQYDALSETVGCDVRPQHVGYPSLCSARAAMSRNAGIEFECVRGVGLKRLDDGEIVSARAQDINAISRRARLARRKLGNADPAKLNEQETMSFYTNATVLSMLGRLSTADAVKKIGVAVAAAGEKLPLAKTLEVFKRE